MKSVFRHLTNICSSNPIPANPTSNMKNTLKIMSLSVALCGLTMATYAQSNTIVVWHDDFDQQPVGASSANSEEGAVGYNFAGTGVGNPTITVINSDPDSLGTDTNEAAFTFDTTPATQPGGSLNFSLELNWLPATGNTDPNLHHYYLEFDYALPSSSIALTNLGGFVGPGLGVYGNYGGEYYGQGCQTFPAASFYPAPGTGYQHVSFNLGTFQSANDTLLPPTDTPLTFFINFYMAGLTVADTNEEIDFDNVQIVLVTNAPPPPPPVMSMATAKPGLRMFAANASEPYNEEGFATMDDNQLWSGATSAQPATYQVNFADWNTVPGFQFQVQFDADPNLTVSPYSIYFGTNVFALTITAQATNYTASIDFKTNAPEGATANNLMFFGTTAASAVGTWTLSFSSATNGTVTAPDGTSGAFTVPPSVIGYFTNQAAILYGIAPQSTAGYGQYIDLKSVSTTNVPGQNIYDDFTKDTFDPMNPQNIGNVSQNYWTTAYSLDAHSMVQVGTNTPYWLMWTLPLIPEWTLETATNVTAPSTSWFTPGYYNGGTAVTTTLMGPTNEWTLIPAADLPTVDGIAGDAISRTGFFRLSTNTPSQ